MLKLTNEEIALPDRYTVSEQAKLSRGLVLSGSKHLEIVQDPTQQAEAAESGRQLQTAIKDVHEARMSLSRPLVEAVDKLIALEKDYCAPLAAEKDRLGRLITAYQQAEKARVEAQEKQRQAEIQRLAQLEDEQTRRAEKARSMAKQMQAELVAANAMEARQELIRAPLPELAKAKGAVTRKRLNFRVTDIHALYKARPDLCKLEPNRAAIVACCSVGMKIDGLDLFEEERTIFRA